MMVNGNETAQYNQNLSDTNHSPWRLGLLGEKLKKLMLKTDCNDISQWSNQRGKDLSSLRTDTKVAGKNVSVNIATVFIAALSLCTASLMRTVVLLSFCAMELYAYDTSTRNG